MTDLPSPVVSDSDSDGEEVSIISIDMAQVWQDSATAAALPTTSDKDHATKCAQALQSMKDCAPV